jgi:hypothetical protein
VDSRDLPHVHRGKKEFHIHRRSVEPQERQKLGQPLDQSIRSEHLDAREVHRLASMGALDPKIADPDDPRCKAELDDFARALKAIVDRKTFDAAQGILDERTANQSDAALLGPKEEAYRKASQRISDSSLGCILHSQVWPPSSSLSTSWL